MALVLLAALDFGIIRTIAPPGGLSPLQADLVVCCVLPMANVLAVGLAILLFPARGEPATRPGLLAFEVAGAAVLGSCLVGALVAPRLRYGLVSRLLDVFDLRPGLLKGAAAIVLFLALQVAASLMGARICRRSRLARSATSTR